MFGFNSAKNNLNLNKPYLIPILDNEGETKLTIVERASQVISSKSSDIQSLDIMIFLVGVTSLVSFLKAYKTPELKSFSLMNGSIIPINC